MAIYISKKNGASYTLEATTKTADGKNVYILSSVEDPTDGFSVAESTFKRWYKKSVEVEVDFTSVPPAPVKDEALALPAGENTTQSSEPVKPAAKTEAGDLKWGLPHVRMSLDDFIKSLGLSSVKCVKEDANYDVFYAYNGKKQVMKRRVFIDKDTHNTWLRYKNTAYELIA